MRIRRIAWLGVRTEAGDAMADFLGDTLGLARAAHEDDTWVYRLPDGAKAEVFGPRSPYNEHFTTGPVVGFLVDDVASATDELRAAGVEIVEGPVFAEEDVAWVHFRAPDGNIYELTQGSDLEPEGDAMASIELGALVEHVVGQPVADAERHARDLGWDVRVKRPGAIYPAGPFRADRANLHVDERDVVIGVGLG